MTAEWDDLARLAEAATPGPWEVDHIDPGVWGPERIVIGNYTAADGFDSPMWEDGTREDRAFIAAANPATILRLIADLRESRAQTERRRGLRGGPMNAADLHPDTREVRPSSCCGVCPPIAGGGWDCTCAGMPGCPAALADAGLGKSAEAAEGEGDDQ